VEVRWQRQVNEESRKVVEGSRNCDLGSITGSEMTTVACATRYVSWWKEEDKCGKREQQVAGGEGEFLSIVSTRWMSVSEWREV
jgi:hypothetical protein